MQRDSTITLENNLLEAELYAHRPVVKGYVYKPNNEKMAGAGGDGMLVINGKSVPWNQFRIKVTQNASQVNYNLSLPEQDVSFDVAFALKDNALSLELGNVRDPEKNLKTIGWENVPMLVCEDSEYSFWRVLTGDPDSGGGKMWMRDQGGQIRSSTAEDGPVPVIYGCLYRPDRLCAFVHSNYPLFPLTHQVTAGKHYAISLNTYQYRVRSRTMPPLKAQVVFLQDENNDGRADLSDYSLWVNRHLPEADPIYHTHIWYKIFCDHGVLGLRTNRKQAQEMVEAIHNVTDGLPQIAYLVGWQHGGHDSKYPSMDTVNDSIGGQAALRELFQVCKQRYNTVLSYHQNIDDAYEDSKDWDPTFCGPHGICHTLDAESGGIFRRLDAMMETIPLEQTVHFDNLRITNTHTAKGFEDISILDELICGLMPVMDYLRARGITVTTEGQNGAPIDLSSLMGALWHYDIPINARQLWHRKIMGGGGGNRNTGPGRMDCAMGYSIHQDFSFLPADKEALGEEIWNGFLSWFKGPGGLMVSFTKEWPEMVNRIYLGTVLYHFFLEREMVKWEDVPGGIRITYAALPGESPVISQCVDDHLAVTWGDVVVADDDHRFVPRDDAIYAYSLAGDEREWVLPEKFRGKELQVFTLSKKGRGPAPDYELGGKTIRLQLAPRTPVKIMIGT